MERKKQTERALMRILRRDFVIDLDGLCRVFGDCSKSTVYRRLEALGYLTSYTHAGRYYTLEDIARFDEYGLWRFRDIGFSRFGTLRRTVVELVNGSRIGMRQRELREMLGVRVQEVVLDLSRVGAIGREELRSEYLYVSVNAARAEEQMQGRVLHMEDERPLSREAVIDVLVEAIYAAGSTVAPSVVASRLNARGVGVTVKQVEAVYGQYDLDVKKTAGSD